MAPKQFFILQDFWPLLKLYQIMGVFPCKKVTDENGCINLTPMKTWMVILLWLIWSLIFAAPYIGIMMYLESDSALITATMASSQTSTTRMCVQGTYLKAKTTKKMTDRNTIRARFHLSFFRILR